MTFGTTTTIYWLHQMKCLFSVHKQDIKTQVDARIIKHKSIDLNEQEMREYENVGYTPRYVLHNHYYQEL